ncbi:AAA family ATPase [uncultured Bacteroides sp.]|uniref:AAA family ATPase n=1 Tax=uncultured Bacteroides sp. TaxID=162156 RepID=UPI00262840A0|nr:AAA family ATPase [uncultured Bacteroides sp.]
MLKHLYLKNFKCFDELSLPLGGLTLITGVNGAGKSSIVQALLLLRQSNDDKRTDLHTHVKADGDLADLTNGNAMRYALSEDADVLIRLTNDQPEEASFTLKDAVTDDTEIACIPSDNIDHVLTAWPLFAPSLMPATPTAAWATSTAATPPSASTKP